MQTELAKRLGIEFPIFAFTHCRGVVAAVSKAGGFGVLGALAFTPEQLEVELAWIDEHVGGKPYGVDIVVAASSADHGMPAMSHGDMEQMLREMIPERHQQFIEDTLARHNVPKLPDGQSPYAGLLGWTNQGAASQVDVALRHPIKLVVNALGPPPKEIVDHVHAHGVQVAALVGTADQARKQIANGVDIIVAQ